MLAGLELGFRRVSKRLADRSTGQWCGAEVAIRDRPEQRSTGSGAWYSPAADVSDEQFAIAQQTDHRRFAIYVADPLSMAKMKSPLVAK